MKIKPIHFMPGEHDAGLDFGTAYQEMPGPTHYTFDHKGVHFIALTTFPIRGMGDTQLGWLKRTWPL